MRRYRVRLGIPREKKTSHVARKWGRGGVWMRGTIYFVGDFCNRAINALLHGRGGGGGAEALLYFFAQQLQAIMRRTITSEKVFLWGRGGEYGMKGGGVCFFCLWGGIKIKVPLCRLMRASMLHRQKVGEKTPAQRRNRGNNEQATYNASNKQYAWATTRKAGGWKEVGGGMGEEIGEHWGVAVGRKGGGVRRGNEAACCLGTGAFRLYNGAAAWK